MILVKEQIVTQIYRQANDQTWDLITPQIRHRVGAHIKFEVWVLVGNQIRSAIQYCLDKEKPAKY